MSKKKKNVWYTDEISAGKSISSKLYTENKFQVGRRSSYRTVNRSIDEFKER